MIFLYSVLTLLLSAVKAVVQRRANALGRTYSALTLAVQKRVSESLYRQGNASKAEVCQAAKVQYELGWMVARRDRIEAKHFAWQHRADALGRWVKNLRSWKGKKLPYTVGAVDVWLLLSAIDAFGVGEFVSARRVFDLVADVLTK